MTVKLLEFMLSIGPYKYDSVANAPILYEPGALTESPVKVTRPVTPRCTNKPAIEVLA